MNQETKFLFSINDKILLISLFLFTLLLIAPLSSSAEFMIVGHRGAAGHAPENTIASILKGIELGVTHVEIDLHQTKDGHVVVIHDSTLNRTTNGEGKVSNHYLSQIKKLDAGSWYSSQYRDERIPTLTEALKTINVFTDVKVILEVKEGSEIYPGIEKNIIQVIRTLKLEDRVIYKSFDIKILSRFKEYAPESPRLLVYVNPFKRVLNKDVDYLQPIRHITSKKNISKAHRSGYKVIAWDVESESKMKKIINLAIDGIETDFPDRLVKVLKEKK